MDTLNPATLLSKRYRPDQIPSLAGKTALVTGGSAGIGYYDALALALAGAKTIIISATEEHGLKAEAEIRDAIKEQGSSGSVEWHQVDLGDLKAVDALIKNIASTEHRMDIVILNAGIGQAPYALTTDGIENHFEVNNLAHYVITLRLLPLLKKTAASVGPTSVRLVAQSSELHRMAPSDAKFKSLEEINEKRDPTVLYGRSKLGSILLIKELVMRHLKDSPNILAMSVHPGTVDTEIQKGPAEAGAYGVLGKIYEVVMRTLGKSAQEGAEASLWAATSTDINPDNWKEYQGEYYSEPYGKPKTETHLAKNEELANDFWEFCASLTKKLLGEELR